jgi:hypothetical protein
VGGSSRLFATGGLAQTCPLDTTDPPSPCPNGCRGDCTHLPGGLTGQLLNAGHSCSVASHGTQGGYDDDSISWSSCLNVFDCCFKLGIHPL